MTESINTQITRIFVFHSLPYLSHLEVSGIERALSKDLLNGGLTWGVWMQKRETVAGTKHRSVLAPRGEEGRGWGGGAGARVNTPGASTSTLSVSTLSLSQGPWDGLSCPLWQCFSKCGPRTTRVIITQDAQTKPADPESGGWAWESGLYGSFQEILNAH